MNWPFFCKPDLAGSDIVTARLRLRHITPKTMAAETAADGSLRTLIQARVGADWPPADWQPHVFAFISAQLIERPETAGWHRYVLLQERRTLTLIGCTGAFPKGDGDVEIGYSTVPAYQRRGYATEAVAALIAWLFMQESVRSVSAQTFPRLTESIKVMERCGMKFVGAGHEHDTVLYRRMR